MNNKDKERVHNILAHYCQGEGNICSMHVKDIHNLLQKLSVNVNEKELISLIRSSYSEDILNETQFQKVYKEAKLLEVFNQLDSDGSGTIEEDEISTAMKKMGYKISAKQCSAMMQKLDTNNDHMISFDEFLAFFAAFPHGSYEEMVESWYSSSNAVDCGNDIAPTVPTPGLKWWQTVIAGGTAGVLARTLTAPLERLKIAAQTGRTEGLGMIHELKTVYKSNGMRGLFAGNFANCIRVFPTAGITCTCYLNLLALTPADTEFDMYEPLYRMGCGGTAALVANTLTYKGEVNSS